MSEVHIFYHKSDSDGKAAGAVLRYWYSHRNHLIFMHPFEYGDKFPEGIDKLSTVVFTDVMVSPYDGMREVIDNYPNLILIDHHQSLIDWLNENYTNHEFMGLLMSGRKAACELAWSWCFGYDNIPKFIKLLSAYDVHDLSDNRRWNREIYPFQLGMKMKNIDPVDNFEFWQGHIFDLPNEDWTDRTIEKGMVVIDYQRSLDIRVMQSNAFEAFFDGLRAICCNSTIQNSQAFESVFDPNKHDLMVSFQITKDNKYRVSLYTENHTIDVSKIAVSYGGGGHPGAAGFQSDRMAIRTGQETHIVFFNLPEVAKFSEEEYERSDQDGSD